MNTLKISERESETVEFKTSFNIETVETLVAFVKLKTKGLLERIGPDKSGYWKITKI